MMKIKGKYNTAEIFTDNVEEGVISQILELCNQEIYKGSKIRIMPDTHKGASCVIGLTMAIKDKICVNFVGVDISCGMRVIKLKEKDIDFNLLDKVIRQHVPSGREVREIYHKNSKQIDLSELKCYKFINSDRALKSLGTLGGGNHFLEIDKDDKGNIYLVIHTGSRYLGKQVAEYYTETAYKKLTDNKTEKDKIITILKSEGREKDIQTELQKIKAIKINKDFAYVEGKLFDDYIHDMKIIQKYAELNRITIAEEILYHMNLHQESFFESVHNYIDTETLILRKGAIDASKGKQLIIPINMRDGAIIGIGKGNTDYNCSAAHGAGRVMSRRCAKKQISLKEFEDSMKGIWTTSVNENTIDESPMAYKPMNEIINNLKDTIDIVSIIKPIYNFKAN